MYQGFSLVRNSAKVRIFTRMISRSEFQEQFKYYDREVVTEILDLFLGSYTSQLLDLRNQLTGGRFDMVSMHAHSLKGLAATFADPDAKALASAIEEKAGKNDGEGLQELVARLEQAVHEMAGELKKIRDEDYA